MVYVVDDDASVRRAVVRLGRSVGLDVVTFASATAYLETPLAQGPACLVLDVRLPALDGLELQARLAHAESTVPIIFITGYGSVPISVRAMKGGAVDFLQKPFDDEDLLSAIERALALSRRARAASADRTEIRRRLDSLTPREREVLDRVVTGMLNKQIAAELGAAEKTIKVHRARVMIKMQAGSVADLVRMASRATPSA